MLFFRLPVNFLLLMTVVLSSRRFLSPQTGTDRLYKGLSDSIRETSLDSKTIWNWSLFDGCSSYSHSVGRSSSSAQKLWNLPFEFKLKDSLRFSKCRPLKNKPYGTVNSKYIFIWSNVSHTFHLFHYAFWSFSQTSMTSLQKSFSNESQAVIPFAPEIRWVR